MMVFYRSMSPHDAHVFESNRLWNGCHIAEIAEEEEEFVIEFPDSDDDDDDIEEEEIIPSGYVIRATPPSSDWGSDDELDDLPSMDDLVSS